MDEATLDNIEQKLDFIALSVNSLEVKCYVLKNIFSSKKYCVISRDSIFIRMPRSCR